MATHRHVPLPLFPNPRDARSTARRQLGGAAHTSPVAGRVVSLRGLGLGAPLGVVLFASDTELDVYIDHGAVRRLPPDRVTPYQGEVPADVAAIATDARVFATLTEGQRVAYTDAAGARAEGALIEKCRYGALVARDDGTVMALGFRKLWPVATRDRGPRLNPS